jgi:hypothetical protein
MASGRPICQARYFNYPKFFEKDKEISKGKLKPVVSFVKA